MGSFRGAFSAEGKIAIPYVILFDVLYVLGTQIDTLFLLYIYIYIYTYIYI